ncbi:very long chain fatty acid elongase 7-like [Arctopsyche grandis]|uniref:very long chain fatty acid elongase 7-like n=1 Tax=Arctopsyche grandis TaxID=121162 RepID=UPI00406D996B
MMLVLRKLLVGYDTVLNVWADPRTSRWSLMGSLFPVLGILIFYLYFVKRIGPQIMMYREPFKLRKLMMAYNAIQILACSFLVWKSFRLAWGGNYKLVCQPVDYSNSEHAIEVARTVYLYFVIKLTDLLDTVFFVFRKKQSHISFLHVYHHAGMVILSWCASKYLPGGHGTSLGVINSMVHIVMYGYYLLSLIDSKYKNSPWWKKHITQLQMLQFLFNVVHFSTLAITPDCEYPPWLAAVIIPQNLFMFMLFGDFYRKAYFGKSSTENDVKNENSSSVKNGYGDKQHRRKVLLSHYDD